MTISKGRSGGELSLESIERDNARIIPLNGCPFSLNCTKVPLSSPFLCESSIVDTEFQKALERTKCSPYIHILKSLLS